jgi:hypothetical protein
LRLAGQIAKVAKEDIRYAITLAGTGKVLTETESTLRIFFREYRELKDVEGGVKKFFLQEVMEKTSGREWTHEEIREQKEISMAVVDKCEQELAAEFIQCLRDEDWRGLDILKRTAKAMSTFKDKGDSLRMVLLAVKMSLDKKGEKLPIREVAQIVGWPEKKSQDGFAFLRRVCKKLEFPLAPSR